MKAAAKNYSQWKSEHDILCKQVVTNEMTYVCVLPYFRILGWSVAMVTAQ